jgi:hypothetical protein
MEETTGDRESTSDFIFNPTGKVIGIIDDPGEAAAALRDLAAAGFTAKEIELLTNEEGAQGIDLRGEESKVSVHIIGSTQKPQEYYDAPGIVRKIEQELKGSHYGIGVGAKDGEARGRVRDILKSHGGHFINFYGRWTAEALEP